MVNSMENNIDLFDNHNRLPKAVKAAIALYNDSKGDLYASCEIMLATLEQIGYTFDYGLDGVPYDLRPV